MARQATRGFISLTLLVATLLGVCYSTLSAFAMASQPASSNVRALRGSRSRSRIVRDQADIRIQENTAINLDQLEAVQKLSFRSEKTRGIFVAAVAACAAFALHTADAATKAMLGLPLWAGPSAGVCVMFAVAAVTAAEHGSLTDYAGVTKFGVQVALAVTGSCAFAVWACSVFPGVAARRTVAVGVAAAWMLLNPASAVFPPSAGYCALYIDQLLANGPMAQLSYTFSVFPCALGVLTVLFASRAATLLGVQPLKMMSRRSQQKRVVA